MANIITGRNANIAIGGTQDTTFGMSGFTLGVGRGVIEQPTLGEKGNYKTQGALTIDGSYTMCKFGGSGNAPALTSLVSGTNVIVSGSVNGSTYLRWYFNSCQVTGFEVTAGDASTISEANVSWQVLNPKDVSFSGTRIADDNP